MSVILLVLGILLTGAGVVMVGLGAPTSESSVGQTLIIAGVTALVGGPLTIGLGVALARLTAIAEALKGRPVRPADGRAAADIKRRADIPVPEPRLPEPPRLPESRPAEPAPASIDVSASAIERLRSSMPRPDRVVTHAEEVPLSPNGGHPPELGLEPKPEAAPRSGAPVEAFREPKLDFLFRARTQRPPQPESFDAMWPKRAAPHGAPDQSKADAVARQPVPPPFVEERRPPPPPVPPPPPPPPPPAPQARSVAILKSGVVDGMAYTLYADGSIEAQLPNGTVRFGSIAELRAHIERNS
jgi:hypothetical protein